MKLTLTITGLIGMIGMASAYTISVTNQSNFGNPDLPILDNAGNPITGGSIGVGYFDSDTDVTANSMNFTDLLGAFNEYGATTAIVIGAVDGLINVVEPTEWDVSVPLGTTGNQVGENLYVIIGNGSDLASSSELAVWKSDATFGTEGATGLGGATADLVSTGGELLLGGSDGTELSGITFASGINLTPAVPEPSTSLLAGLAGLALAARRRR